MFVVPNLLPTIYSSRLRRIRISAISEFPTDTRWIALSICNVLDLKIGILTLSSSNAVGPPANAVLTKIKLDMKIKTTNDHCLDSYL